MTARPATAVEGRLLRAAPHGCASSSAVQTSAGACSSPEKLAALLGRLLAVLLPSRTLPDRLLLLPHVDQNAAAADLENPLPAPVRDDCEERSKCLPASPGVKGRLGSFNDGGALRRQASVREAGLTCGFAVTAAVRAVRCAAQRPSKSAAEHAARWCT
jgi:hypothetical protein